MTPSTMPSLLLHLSLLLASTQAGAQHLWWNTRKLDRATCLYGEITVLATGEGIYFCGANWHPGEPAGGYCGIQHNSPTERRTIFSIWDTAPKLNPHVTHADAATLFNRFGGEFEGGHTHMLWNWKLGDTFRFFLRKQPGSTPDTTDALYYVFDRSTKKWRHSATIASPNGDAKSAPSVMYVGGGGLASFLENFLGKDRAAPKLALYRLWLGSDAGHLQCLTHADGDGTWGQLDKAYFLAEGARKQLDALFVSLENQHGKPVLGPKGKQLEPIPNQPVPAVVVNELNSLPQAEQAQEIEKR